MQLRPYQKSDVRGIVRRLQSDGRALLCRPTGTGKTVTAAEVLRRVPGRRAIIVHRRELLAQWVRALVEAKICAPPPGDLKLDQAAEHCGVFMYRRATARRAARDADLLVVDECHLSPAKLYRRLIGSRKRGAKLLGLTATPFRLDEDEDGAVVQGMYGDAFGDGLQTVDFIKRGVLAPIGSRFGPNTYLDCYLDGYRAQNYQETEGEIARRLLHVDAPRKMADAWAKHAAKRRGLLCTAGVAVAEMVLEQLAGHGIAAELFAGRVLASEERERIIARFRAGKTSVLVTCGAMTEGFDDDSIDTIMFGRPCFSKALACQLLGRALRRGKARKRVLILDACGVMLRHPDILQPLSGLTDRVEQPLDAIYCPATGEPERRIPREDERALRVERGIITARDAAERANLIARAEAWARSVARGGVVTLEQQKELRETFGVPFAALRRARKATSARG